jgi:DNA polymerase I-like protein with 3'-5' exonuclease and polymerase domains
VIPHIQIHDELDISVASLQEAEKIIDIMEQAVELQVPNKVDFEKGDSWGDIK